MYEIVGTTASVTYCGILPRQYPSVANILPEVRAFPVTKIGNHAFFLCFSLKSVSISNSVTEIEEWAFGGCKSLELVTIPDSVTKIGDRAFAYCKSLESITIPDSVTKIGDRAFAYCKSLESITIPDSVTEIGNGVFKSCDNLKEIILPQSWANKSLADFYDIGIDPFMTTVFIGNNNTKSDLYNVNVKEVIT